MTLMYSMLGDLLLYEPDKINFALGTKMQLDTDHIEMDLSYWRQKTINMAFWVDDEILVEQLREIAKSPTFHDVYFSSEHYSGYVNITSLSSLERGGYKDVWKTTLQAIEQGSRWVYTWRESPLSTYWDTLVDEPFTESTGGRTILDGAAVTSDTGYLWFALQGQWNYNGADYLECTIDNGYNQIVWWHMHLADVDISADVYVGAGAVDAGIFARSNGIANLTYPVGYYLSIENPNIIELERCNGTTRTPIRTWTYGGTIETTTYYTLRMRIVGDRIDCWFNGEPLTEDEEIIDKVYSAGYVGLVTETASNSRFDNFQCEIGKPAQVMVPPGDSELNSYYESRVPTSRGLSKLLVGPRKPVTFDERNAHLHDPNLVLDLRFNEGDGDVIDHSDHGFDLGVSNGLWSTDGYNSFIPLSLRYEDTKDIVSDDASLTPTHAMTLEAIFKLDKHSANYSAEIVSKWMGGGAGYQLYCLGSAGSDIHELQWQIYDGAGNNDKVKFVVPVDTWIHAICTYENDGSSTNPQILYVDGVTKSTSIGTTDHILADSGQNLTVGGYYGNNNRNIVGNVALVRIYSGVKDATWAQDRFAQLGLNRTANNEVYVYDVPRNTMADGYWEDSVLHLKFNEGSGSSVIDSSKNGLTVTTTNITNADWEDSLHPSFGTCLDFDDTTDTLVYVQNADKLKIWDSDWTVIIWFKTTGTERSLWLASDAYSTLTDYVRLHLGNGANDISLLYNGSSGADTWVIDSTTSYHDGNWHMAAVTYDSVADEFGAFIDSTDMGTDARSSVGTFATVDSIQLFGLGTTILNGNCDEFRVLKRKLSGTEISWLWNNAPMVCDESLWQRVYNITHEFEGGIVMHNGQVKFSTIHQKLPLDYQLACWSQGRWQGLRYSPTYSSLSLAGNQRGLIELKRDIATLRDVSVYTGVGMENLWTDFTMRSGNPMVQMKSERAI